MEDELFVSDIPLHPVNLFDSVENESSQRILSAHLFTGVNRRTQRLLDMHSSATASSTSFSAYQSNTFTFVIMQHIYQQEPFYSVNRFCDFTHSKSMKNLDN